MPEIAADGPKRVVVQAHLLLRGHLMRQVKAEIEVARTRWPVTEWMVTEPLGPHPLLVEAVKETTLAELRT